LLITTDSGPRHFAAAFNTPVITLFGPTHISWTRTYHPRAWHLFHPVPCGPCQRPVCPEGHHQCMRDLSPGSVFQVALRALSPGNGVSRSERIAGKCFAGNSLGDTRGDELTETRGTD
jgi:heptosyltransferase-2